MNKTRREILKLAGVAGVVGVTGGGISVVHAQTTEAAPAKAISTDGVVGMLYDATLCVGCQVCVRSCYETNFLNRSYYVDQVIPPEEQSAILKEDLKPVIAPKDQQDPSDPKIYSYANDYRFRNVIQKYVDAENGFHFVKRQCMHCNKPGCVSACPVKAMTKNEADGVVEYNQEICIGCRYCQIACPFNIPKFEWHRAVPKIVKCELCKDTLWNDAASGKTPQTACTRDCPQKAVIFGNRDALMAEAKKRLAENPDKYNPTIYGEEVYGGTGVIYLLEAGIVPENLGFPAQLGVENYAEKSEKLQHTIYKFGIAPLALYGTLAYIGVKNAKKHKGGDDE
jgi:Fe-S-cluster-containing dehydrogenase component